MNVRHTTANKQTYRYMHLASLLVFNINSLDEIKDLKSKLESNLEQLSELEERLTEQYKEEVDNVRRIIKHTYTHTPLF